LRNEERAARSEERGSRSEDRGARSERRSWGRFAAANSWCVLERGGSMKEGARRELRGARFGSIRRVQREQRSSKDSMQVRPGSASSVFSCRKWSRVEG
jgi:hypothetical protein